MTVAFVFSGGTNLGAVQVGMALALADHEVTPDLIVGTSVGAVNGAWLASGRAPDGLATLWRAIRRRDVFPLRPMTGLAGFAGRRRHFVPDSGLRRLLREHLTFDRIENAPIPLAVVATDAATGAQVVLDHGPLVRAVLASAALPAVFPPVRIDGRLLIDGGIANNTPITLAIEAGATEVWVLTTGYACSLSEPPTGAIALGLHAVSLLVQQRLSLELATRTYPVPVHVIPPPCPITAAPTDFTQTSELIDRARSLTRQWVTNGCPDVTTATPHTHVHRAPSTPGPKFGRQLLHHRVPDPTTAATASPIDRTKEPDQP